MEARIPRATTFEKFYVTREGLERLRKACARLLEFKHQKTREGTPVILHSEEVSPEYLVFQEDMSLLDARLAECEKVLHNAELITCPEEAEQHRVCIGATVTLEIEGVVDQFTVVGTLEADPAQKKISHESPLGNALFGAKVGSVVSIETPFTNYKGKVLKLECKI